MVILVCCDDHQEVKVFFLLRRVSWGFSPHSMRNGDARHVVATWRVLKGRFNAPLRVTLGFPAIFYFILFYFFNFLCLVF